MIKSIKLGFTLVEGLICILLVSAMGMASLYVLNGYYKQAFTRDKAIKTVADNMNTIENLKADVESLHQLYDFSQKHDIHIVAVGVGEIKLTKIADGSIKKEVISSEKYDFSLKLRSDYRLYRIETASDVPNTRLITILRLKE